MFNRLQLFLGPQRVRLLFLLLAFTGTANLILNSVVNEVSWARDAQTLVVLLFIGGSIVIVGTRLDAHDRGRWVGLLLPSGLAILIGIFFLPDALPLILGGAVGWVIAGLFLFRPRGPMEYQKAVKHLRKNNYQEAVYVLDDLIKTEADNANHYRFRAEVLRVWGKLERARNDYQKMTKVAGTGAERAVAYNGLAEVHLQLGNYEKAQAAAEEAYALAPGQWVAAYNLGMIEDRLKESEKAVEHLNLALEAKVPDARHRLLIHFYLARAYMRLGDTANAQDALANIKRHGGGLNEWDVILQSDQAETLRAVLADDIRAAQALADDEISLEDIV